MSCLQPPPSLSKHLAFLGALGVALHPSPSLVLRTLQEWAEATAQGEARGEEQGFTATMDQVGM